MESQEEIQDTGSVRRLILVVEDDGLQVRLTRLSLERVGFQVIAARDGLNALSQAEAHRPNLVILDVDLPGLNGFQVLDRLRNSDDTRDIPVLMLTAHAKDSTLFQEWAAGQDAFMTKPFSPSELVSTVQRILAPG